MKTLARAAVAVVLAVASFALPVTAHAATVDSVIGNVTPISTSSYLQGHTLDSKIDWYIPAAGVTDGDTFTLDTPPQLIGWTTPSLIDDITGEKIADGTIAGTLITFTFTPYAAAHPGLVGSSRITSTLKQDVIVDNQPTDVTLNYTTTTATIVRTIKATPAFTIRMSDSSGNPGTSAAPYSTGTDSTITWTVTNASQYPATNIIVAALPSPTSAAIYPTCTFPDATTGPEPWTGSLSPAQTFTCVAPINAAAQPVPGGLYSTKVTVTGDVPSVGTIIDANTFFLSVPTPVQHVALSGRVWDDANTDNVYTPDELGIAAAALTVTRTDGGQPLTVSGTPVSGAVTANDGSYLFDLEVLPVGVQYAISVATPTGYVRTRFNSGETSSSSDQSITAIDSGLNFGFYQPHPAVTIAKGDSNGNAADTPATAVDLGYGPGSADLVFTVTNSGNEVLTDFTISDQVVDGGIVSALTCRYPQIGADSVGAGTTSDAGGTWHGRLAPTLTIVCAATLTGVTADAMHYDIGSVTATGVDSGVTVADSNPYYAKVKAAATVGDTVWLDTNRDGIQNGDEHGIAGITLALTRSDGAPTVDVDGNPVPTLVTDADGHYLFTRLPLLPAGVRYVVNVVTATGLHPIAGNTGTAESKDLTPSDSTDTSLDFGYYPDEPAPTAPINTIDTGIITANPEAAAGIGGGVALALAGLVTLGIVARRRRA